MSIISNCTASVIKEAATSLMNGNLVAFPTETVYGLGADATNKDAVARIYEVKSRPVGHPLIVHISSIIHLNKWAKDIPDYAINLARAFWPGPMTLILPRTELAKDFITGGQNNVGVRVPSHKIALALLNEFEAQGGVGVAAPSANRFGAVSPTTANAALVEIGEYLSTKDQVLDGGACTVGVESTIIYCTESKPSILRPGGVTKVMIEEILEDTMNVDYDNFLINKVKAPGLMGSHYAPRANVFLSGEPKRGDGLIALSNVNTPEGVHRLASPENNEQFAQQLYRALRSADEKGLQNVYVVPPSGDDIAIAINDRLRKASKGRG
jgi:L-threonylcarbamoyladenylate synthase